MEILTLNLWHGKEQDRLLAFLKKQAKHVDVFCFQEASLAPKNGVTPEGFRDNTFGLISQVLPGFTGTFSAYTRGIGHQAEKEGGDLQLGQAIFTRDGVVEVVGTQAPFIVGKFNGITYVDGVYNWPTLLQLVDLKVAGELIRIGNYHGVSQPGDKRDNPVRIEQSKRLLELVSDTTIPTILAGDFNLFPDTQSIGMIEQAGFRNLVTDFNILTTRSSLSPHHNKPTEQKFADYIFTRGITVGPGDFKALADEEDIVSDHLALRVKFNLPNLH